MSTEAAAIPMPTHHCGTIGSGAMGAPTFHYNVLVNPITHEIHGFGSITQAVAPPHNMLHVNITSGRVNGLGIIPYSLLITMQGTVSNPPSMLVSPFTAHMMVDMHWNGIGGFEYLGHHIENVKAVSGPCLL